MDRVKIATDTINEALKMFDEEPLSVPTEGTIRQRLEVLLDVYTDRLVAKQPNYQIFSNKKEIPDMIVMYLVKMIDKAT
jgi:hypothetical protein